LKIKENDMPNYIDKDKLIRDLIDNRNFYPAIVKRAIENAPTEDVVPRSEVEKAKQKVAREILDEFECHISTGIRILKDCINDTDTDQEKRHLLGRLHELCGMEKSIAELRKKYIGE
jgi:hypothetical protein